MIRPSDQPTAIDRPRASKASPQGWALAVAFVPIALDPGASSHATRRPHVPKAMPPPGRNRTAGSGASSLYWSGWLTPGSSMTRRCGPDVPEPQVAVVVGDRQGPSVGAEVERADAPSVAEESGDLADIDLAEAQDRVGFEG